MIRRERSRFGSRDASGNHFVLSAVSIRGALKGLDALEKPASQWRGMEIEGNEEEKEKKIVQSL